MTSRSDRSVRNTAQEAGSRARAFEGMDDIDWVIVSELNNDARATHTAIAKLVGLTPPAVRGRISKLEAAGVIEGYRTTLDPAKLGFEVSALIAVELRSYTPDAVSEFESAVEREGRITECFALMGSEDYLLKVVALDVRELADYLRHSIGLLPWIARFESKLLLGAVKNDYSALTDGSIDGSQREGSTS